VNPRLVALTGALSLVMTLTACGKAGSPTVPGSAFPLPYPNPKLSPSQTAEPTATADQPGMQADNKSKFTDKGSYIDPSVKDTELRRGAVAPGATLPYTQTSAPGSNTPFNQSSGIQGASPLGSTTGTTPQEDEQPPP